MGYLLVLLYPNYGVHMVRRELYSEVSGSIDICGCQTIELVDIDNNKITAKELCYYHDELVTNSMEDMQNDPSNYEGIDGCEWADKLAEE